MPGIGPPPKNPTKRRRANADLIPARKLPADDELCGPDLPGDAFTNGESWHPRTVVWWATWRRSAQAREFLATDWDFQIDTALMHHAMWTKRRWEFASELRLRAAKFGATIEDRTRLRRTIEVPADEAVTGKPRPDATHVTDIRSRRARLTS